MSTIDDLKTAAQVVIDARDAFTALATTHTALETAMYASLSTEIDALTAAQAVYDAAAEIARGAFDWQTSKDALTAASQDVTSASFALTQLIFELELP